MQMYIYNRHHQNLFIDINMSKSKTYCVYAKNVISIPNTKLQIRYKHETTHLF